MNKIGSLSKIKKVYSELEQQFEREPSAAELAAAMDLPEFKVKEALKVAGRHVSFDAPFQDGETGTLLDVLPNRDAPKTDQLMMEQSLNTEIERSLDTLTERQKDVVKLYFGIGVKHEMSLAEIGEKYGISRERVRQIKDKALRKLKHSARNKHLKAYLG